jgi:hypothetical protein
VKKAKERDKEGSPDMKALVENEGSDVVMAPRLLEDMWLMGEVSRDGGLAPPLS